MPLSWEDSAVVSHDLTLPWLLDERLGMARAHQLPGKESIDERLEEMLHDIRKVFRA